MDIVFFRATEQELLLAIDQCVSGISDHVVTRPMETLAPGGRGAQTRWEPPGRCETTAIEPIPCTACDENLPRPRDLE